MVNFKIGRKKCVNVVFFLKKKSLLKVFFQVRKWSSFGLIFIKLGLPEKLGTLGIPKVPKGPSHPKGT